MIDKEKQLACQKCGSCCETVGVWYGKHTPDLFDLLKWGSLHRGTIVYAKSSNVWGVEYPLKCSHLEDNECNVFENRPQVCRARGIVPDDLRGCTDLKRFKNIVEVEKWLGQQL